MKILKENNGILPTKTLLFSLINRRISPQLSNTLRLQDLAHLAISLKILKIVNQHNKCIALSHVKKRIQTCA